MVRYILWCQYLLLMFFCEHAVDFICPLQILLLHIFDALLGTLCHLMEPATLTELILKQYTVLLWNIEVIMIYVNGIKGQYQ